MADEKEWSWTYASASWDGGDEIFIEYGNEEVATIRMDHEKTKELTVVLRKSEKAHEISVEFLLEVLQIAKDRLPN